MKITATFTAISIFLSVSNFSFAQKKHYDKHPIEQFYVVINSGISLLEWTVKGESDWYECVIERSNNGVDFETIGIKTGIASNADMKYVFVDKIPSMGKNYYRIIKKHSDHFSFSYQEMVLNKLQHKIDWVDTNNSLVSSR